MEAYEYLEKIRAAAPRVHCITNYVTAHDVANMILACGANPVMADEPQEMGEITAHAGALALNMGTPGERREQAMLAAGKAANANGIPVVLDPVGVGASAFRRKMAEELLEAVTFTAIRGNMSEIRKLSELAEKKVTGSSGGVDVCPVDVVTEETLTEAVTFVKAVSKRLGAVVAVCGDPRRKRGDEPGDRNRVSALRTCGGVPRGGTEYGSASWKHRREYCGRSSMRGARYGGGRGGSLRDECSRRDCMGAARFMRRKCLLRDRYH